MSKVTLYQPDLFTAFLCPGCAGTGITWQPMKRYDPAGDLIEVVVGTVIVCASCDGTGKGAVLPVSRRNA